MDDMPPDRHRSFRGVLGRRQFSAHTVASYLLDLHVFFAEVTVPLAHVSVSRGGPVVERRIKDGRRWATINRRLHALKHFFAFLPRPPRRRGNPVKPVILCGAGTSQSLSQEQVQRLWARSRIHGRTFFS